MDSIPALGGTEVTDLWSDEVGDTFRIFVGHADPGVVLSRALRHFDLP